MVLGVKVWSWAPKKLKKPRKKGCGGSEKPRSTWVASRTHSPDAAAAPSPPPATGQLCGRSTLTRPAHQNPLAESKIGSNHPGSNLTAAPSAMKIPDSSSCLSPPPSPSSRAPAPPFSPSPWRRSGGVESGEVGPAERVRGRRRRMGSHSADASALPLLKAHFRVADAWVQAIMSNPLTVAHEIRGEKGGTEIKTPCLSTPLTTARSAWRAATKISNPAKSGILYNRSRQRFHVKDNTRRMTL